MFNRGSRRYDRGKRLWFDGRFNQPDVKVDVNLRGSKTNPSDDKVYFNVSPNPTNDFMYINISKDVTAEIMDMNGRILMSGIEVAANCKQRLDVSHLPDGIYIVRVFGDDYTSIQRVYVEK